MLDITATAGWRAAHPGARIGLLEIAGVDNTHASPQLNQRKRETEARLRAEYTGFSRADFLALPLIAAYEQYYKRFNKTYHVQLQLESIVLKGKSLPDVSPLVDANFTAEVSTLVLTAGHAVDQLAAPLVIDVSREDDAMTLMNGTTRIIQAGDMIMRDAQRVCCSIIYGQDNHSPITAQTRHVLYVAYAPAGVPQAAVEDQLCEIESNVRLFAPDANVAQSRILTA